MLVTCQSCAQQISDKAIACPKCKASGDDALGKPVPCFECGTSFRASMQSCASCGAPVVVALGKLTADEIANLPTLKKMPWTSDADKTVERIRGLPSQKREPAPHLATAELDVQAPANEQHLPPKAQNVEQKPGFARGKFGKALAYPLFIIGLVGMLISLSEWYSSWQYGQPAEYAGGRVIAMVIIVSAGVRALVRRSHRSLLDWFLAAFLLLLMCGTIYSLVAMLISPRFYIDGLALLYLALAAMIIVSSFVVMVRLLRQPFYIRGKDGERPQLA